MELETGQQNATDTSVEHTPQDNGAVQTDETQSQSSFVNPFNEHGKAKFKVDGQEIEADWETIQREYQLTKKSRMMMDEAAGIKRRAEETLRNLYAAAERDPEGFLRTLNPRWNPQRAASQAQIGSEQESSGGSLEQLAAQLREQLLQEFNPIKEKLEQYELAQEREALNKEFEDVASKFPVFKGRVEKQFLMSQYKAALENDLGLSLEEVAFIANRELEEDRRAREDARAQRQQDLKQKAPVVTRPAGGEGVKKPMSLEDVKKLAGRL